MSTRAIASSPQPAVDSRPAVTVLSGFSTAATDAVARILQLADPHLLVVSHDISRVRDGVVHRTVRTATELLERETVQLVHGCVACTLREDVLPTLIRSSQRGADIVLALPPVVEPEAVAAACAHHTVDGTAVTEAVRFDSYVTVVEAASLLETLSTSDDLRHRDLHAADNDHRSVADVVARQIEYADTIVTWEHPALDGCEAARVRALLTRLAPWATQLRIGDTTTVDCTGMAARLRRTGRHDPAVPGTVGRALEGFPIGVHEPSPDWGVVSTLFESRRPFHPQRLHDALEELTAEALRGRGQLWIASQPDTALAWESAGGGVSLGTLGHWLAALPQERWTEASDYRRIAAELDWDPYYGDRRTTLAFIGLHIDADRITRLLTSCLLTDAEIAGGVDAWRGLPDPFADCFPLTGDGS